MTSGYRIIDYLKKIPDSLKQQLERESQGFYLLFEYQAQLTFPFLQSFSVKRESSGSESRGVYFTLAFAGVALMMAMVVGIVVLRRRNSTNPHNQVSTVNISIVEEISS